MANNVLFIDMHHHVIYGVDDGAKDFDATQRMLQEAIADGIGYLITTPHIQPGLVSFPYETYYQHLAEAQAWCQAEGNPIRLYPGAEVFYTQNTPRLLREGKIPTLADSRFVLLEFSPGESYEQLCDAARKIGGAGFVPIFAHIERYNCLKRTEQLTELRDSFGVRLQMNARTVIRKNGFFRDRWIRRILESELVDYIATDSHDMPMRHACMRECFQKLTQEYGAPMARKLTYENPLEIFQQEESRETENS